MTASLKHRFEKRLCYSLLPARLLRGIGAGPSHVDSENVVGQTHGRVCAGFHTKLLLRQCVVSTPNFDVRVRSVSHENSLRKRQSGRHGVAVETYVCNGRAVRDTIPWMPQTEVPCSEKHVLPNTESVAAKITAAQCS